MNTRLSLLLAIRALALLLTLATAAKAAEPPVPAAVREDPPRDAAHPATLTQLEIPSHGSTLFGVFYRASGPAPHPTALVLHGLPGFERNSDIAQTLRRAGWNTLIFHYRGAWGSGGTFSFTHSIEDVQSVLAWLRVPDNADRLGVDPRRLVLIGHSFGGFLAGTVTALDPAVLGAALISPANPGTTPPPGNPQQEQVLLQRYRDNSGPLSGTSAEALLAEVRANSSQWDLRRRADKWGARPILIVESDDALKADNIAIAAELRKLQPQAITEQYFATDHSYSDHRIALQTTLLDWLSRFERK